MITRTTAVLFIAAACARGDSNYPVYRLRRGIMKHESIQATGRAESAARVALCVTGNERAVLRPMVRESMLKHVNGPMEAHGGVVHTFLVIGVVHDDSTYRSGYRSHDLRDLQGPDPSESDASNLRNHSLWLEREIRRVWAPTGLLVGRSPTDMAVEGKSACSWLNGGDTSEPLLGQESIPGFFSQFLKVKLAWGLVLAEETRPGGQRYDWILRVRSDVVLFAPAPPLGGIARHRAVFVPRNGMANNPDAAFRNDQVFLCPRAHCDEYFTLVDLFTRCDPADRLAAEAAKRDANAAHVPTFRELGGDNSGDAVAKRAYVPPFPRGSWCQWWMARRYGGIQGVTSGRLREVTWSYTVARAEWIECERTAYREHFPTGGEVNSGGASRLGSWLRVGGPTAAQSSEGGAFVAAAAALAECAKASAASASSRPLATRPDWEQHVPSAAVLPNAPDVGDTCSPAEAFNVSAVASPQKKELPGELACAPGLQLAYAVLLSRPSDPALPTSSSEGGPPFSYFDYVHTMVQRIILVSPHTSIDIVVMVTGDVPLRLRQQLRDLSSRVVLHETREISIEANFDHKGSAEDNSRWRFTGTKLAVFNLTSYDRVLLLDSDTFMLSAADNVFCDVTLVNEAGIHFSFAAASESHRPPQLPAQGLSHALLDDGHPEPAKFAGQEARDKAERERWQLEHPPSPRVNLFSSVVLVRPSARVFSALLEALATHAREHPRGGAIGDQDILTGMFMGNMSCLPPRFNCRIHHSATGLCFGLRREGDVFASVDIVHAKLGVCAVAGLLPRAHELWLRGLPPGRLGDMASPHSGEKDGAAMWPAPCPVSPGSISGLTSTHDTVIPAEGSGTLRFSVYFLLFLLAGVWVVTRMLDL